MATAIIGVAKSMVGRFENLREILPRKRIIEAIEFLTLLLFPILLPFGIMVIASVNR